ETPGLGSKITEDWFLAQFAGKPLSDPFRASDDVQAITGATVSTRRVADTVSQSARALLAAMGVTVEVEDASGGAGAGGAAAGGSGIAAPAYEARVRRALGERVVVARADAWRVNDQNGRLMAWAVRVDETGDGGPVSLLELLYRAGPSVRDLAVLSLNETPGLGD